MSSAVKGKFGLGWKETAAASCRSRRPTSPPSKTTSGKKTLVTCSRYEFFHTVCLLYTSDGLGRFDFFCDGELVPTFSRFKRIWKPGAKFVALFVGDFCDYRFRVDTLPCGKRALRELRRRLASQFSYWKARRARETNVLRKPVRFVRGRDAPVKSSRRVQQVEAPTFWGRLPRPDDERVVGTPLALPAHDALRAMPKQSRYKVQERYDDHVPMRELSSVVFNATSDKHGEPQLPLGDPYVVTYTGDSDWTVRSAVSRHERLGALRSVEKFSTSLADRFGSVAEPSGGDGAFGRLEARLFGDGAQQVEGPASSAREVADAAPASRREASSREVSSFNSSALAGFF